MTTNRAEAPPKALLPLGLALACLAPGAHAAGGWRDGCRGAVQLIRKPVALPGKSPPRRARLRRAPFRRSPPGEAASLLDERGVPKARAVRDAALRALERGSAAVLTNHARRRMRQHMISKGDLVSALESGFHMRGKNRRNREGWSVAFQGWDRRRRRPLRVVLGLHAKTEAVAVATLFPKGRNAVRAAVLAFPAPPAARGGPDAP